MSFGKVIHTFCRVAGGKQVRTLKKKEIVVKLIFTKRVKGSKAANIKTFDYSCL
jgi:hypothetical protein